MVLPVEDGHPPFFLHRIPRGFRAVRQRSVGLVDVGTHQSQPLELSATLALALALSRANQLDRVGCTVGTDGVLGRLASLPRFRAVLGAAPELDGLQGRQLASAIINHVDAGDAVLGMITPGQPGRPKVDSFH